MQLVVTRTTYTDESTIGKMMVDGLFECFTLEDVPRKKKIWGKTAIPAGQYEVVIADSPRFKRKLPRLLDVPGFNGVLIHPGNTAEDTHGCILVGATASEDFIGSSRAAFKKLFAKLEQAAARGEKITIRIENTIQFK